MTQTETEQCNGNHGNQVSANQVQTETVDTGDKIPKTMPSHLEELWEKSKGGLTTQQQSEAFDFIIKNQDCFAESKDDMGLTNIVQHKIHTGNAAPVKLGARRMPIHQRQVEKDEIDSMLKRGVIEPSDSPWRAAIVLVPKKGKQKNIQVLHRFSRPKCLQS